MLDTVWFVIDISRVQGHLHKMTNFPTALMIAPINAKPMTYSISNTMLCSYVDISNFVTQRVSVRSVAALSMADMFGRVMYTTLHSEIFSPGFSLTLVAMRFKMSGNHMYMPFDVTKIPNCRKHAKNVVFRCGGMNNGAVWAQIDFNSANLLLLFSSFLRRCSIASISS